jgi:hypothetical protein
MFKFIYYMVLLTYLCLAVTGVSSEVPSEEHSGVPGTDVKQNVSPAPLKEIKLEPLTSNPPQKITLPDYSVYHTRCVLSCLVLFENACMYYCGYHK